MRSVIVRILSTNGPITTALFIDGGEELVATGVSTGVGEYAVGQEVIVFFDDRYNRLKFHSSQASSS